jgi:hypothetical protein
MMFHDQSDHISVMIFDRRPSEEAIMNILLWYLPYAMFSGACDVVLAESGTRMGNEQRADSPERERDPNEAALAHAR